MMREKSSYSFLRSLVERQDHSFFKDLTGVLCTVGGTLVSFMLSDIHLIFGTLLCHTKIQIKFEFGFSPSFLEKYLEFSVFRTFSICASFDIWYIALPYQDIDQV
jgi:hypothetical protein